jgi:hypothetical protein
MTGQLAAKIAKAALDVGGKLSADKTNQEQRYDYLSADKILSVCGQALFSQGVVTFPDLAGADVNLFEYTDNFGKSKRRYDAKVNIIINITDGTETQALNWYGMGSDYTVPDKALYKAITSGHKYFLMKLLCVGAGNEDGEHEDEPPAQKQPRQPEQPKREPKPAPATLAVNHQEPPEPPAREQAGDPEWQATAGTAPMTLEEAKAFKTKDGYTYGVLSANQLQHIANSLGSIENPTKAEQDKLLAAQVIIKARANGQPA